MQRFRAVAVALIVSLAACSSAGSSARNQTPDSVAAVVSPAPPGTLVSATKVDKPQINPPATIWRILYHSRNRENRDVVVSGFALVPDAPAPVGGRPVYAWAHGTTGLGDQCAPSRDIRDNLPEFGAPQLQRGAVLVATDYEGLGTPGPTTYLVGASEGHAVLDSVRAITRLRGVGKIGAVVIAGQSEGGGAALFAGQLARTYAPELHLVGVVASAPAAELATVAAADMSSANKGVLLLASDGFRAAYPNFDPGTFLTHAAVADLGRVAGECVDAVSKRYQDTPSSSVFARAPQLVPAVRRVLDENSPGARSIAAPVLIVQGGDDEQIPVSVSARLAAKYCALGVAVTRKVYPGQSHDGVLDAAQPDVLRWISDRYAGRSPSSTCS